MIDRLNRSLTQGLLSVCLSLPAAGNAAPSSADPRWSSARAALEGIKNLVASDITTDMEMFDGDGQAMGTMRIAEKIAGWKDGEPVREIYSNSNPEHASVARARFKVAVDNHPERALREGDIDAIDTTTLDGKKCTVFRVHGLTGDKANIPFKGSVWIDDQSGVPLRTTYSVSNLGAIKSMTQSISFATGPDGKWLPAGAVVDVTVSMFVKTMRLVSKYQFLSWTPRP